MNFDTRTVLDLFKLDPDLKSIVSSIVDAEKVFWARNGNTSENEFVRYVLPLVKDELNFYLKRRAYRKKLHFLRPLINLDKVDYYRVIPEISDI